MRPPEPFIRPRSVVAADVDAPLSGHTGVGGSLGGDGSGTAPAMTYFLAVEDDVGATAESSCGAGYGCGNMRDRELLKRGHQQQQQQHQQPQPPHSVHQYQQPPQLTQHRRVEASAPDAAAAAAAAAMASSSTPLRRDDGHVSHDGRDEATRHEPSSSPADTHDHEHMAPLSPLLSRPATPSLFGTPGPASLSALSSPSSRLNSLTSSFLDDGGAGGGDSEQDPVLADGGRFGSGFDGCFSPGSASGGDPAGPTPSASSFLAASSRMTDSGSAPQLIMPSIQMPSRRPFTDTGRQLGRLKVLIAGDTGLGKTSLIKAIVQSCLHIVHVDHISPLPLSGRRRSAPAAATPPPTTTSTSADRPPVGRAQSHQRPRLSRPDRSTGQITEIYASTKPYPAWWSELDGVCHPTKRKSLGDNVLDRNICFVDTPGFSGQTSTMDAVMPVVQYVESFLHRLRSNSLSDADLISLLTGDGGLLIDVVFYLVSGDLKPADIEYLRLLAPLTNIIPLVARADTMASEAEVARAKERIAKQLREANIRPFAFTSDAALELALAASSAPASASALPYAVSSTPGSDLDTMDASLLMSPDYVQPLVPTELAKLVEQVFCQDGASRLRHAAARKSVQWRKSELGPPPPRPQSLYRPLSLGGALLPSPLGSPPPPSSSSSSSFALARMTDYTQREERLAQIRLASWAAELQRHLDGERARFESLARSERAVWLTERLSECVQDGTLVAVAADQQQSRSRGLPRQQGHRYRADLLGQNKKGKKKVWAMSSKASLSTSLCREDPLGLLEVTASLRARGWLALEVLGSLSMLGGVALWMARYNYHLQVYGWVVDEWAKFWNGGR